MRPSPRRSSLGTSVFVASILVGGFLSIEGSGIAGATGAKSNSGLFNDRAIGPLRGESSELESSSSTASHGASAIVAYRGPSDIGSLLGGDQSVDPTSTVLPSWIVNGQTCKTCAWPATAEMGTGSCTGTLIHPKVITTAAHCTPKTGQKFTFGEGQNTVSATATKCMAGAQGSGGVNTKADWAYCVLDKELTGVPYMPPLTECEAAKFLKVGVKVWLVGFGITSASGGGAGTKREVEVPVNKVGDGIVDVGLANGTGACHGDSGGPAYIHLVDASNDYGWRVFGSTSGPGSSGCDCTCTTVYVNIANHVKAIEKNEMIDVTPCTDANGTWEGGPSCKDFPLDPQNSGGTWPTCNNKKTGVLTTCGPNGGGTDAGTDGGSGTGGAAGAGGTAGASGSGGTGGAAGTSGAAGSAGTAGRGGSAGSGGAAGTAGTSGAAGSNTGGSAGSGGSGGLAGSAGASGSGGSAGGDAAGGSGGAGGASGKGTGGGAGATAGDAGRSGSNDGGSGRGASTDSDAGRRPEYRGDPDPGCGCRTAAAGSSSLPFGLSGFAAVLAAIAHRSSTRSRTRKASGCPLYPSENKFRA